MTRADLHFHLLPGVDDGPADFSDSLELARGAVAEGTSTIASTPHVRFDLGITDATEIRRRTCELRARLGAFDLPLEVECGGELGHEVIATMRQHELDMLAHGPPGARWLLVETPFEGVGRDFHAAADELRDRGFGVLLAHPERSADAALDGFAGLRRELGAGSRAQLNAGSLTGHHGEDALAAAWALIRAGLVAAIASDAHGPTRPPALSAARRALVDGGLSRPAADRLVRSGPRRLLESGIELPAERAA
jgi:protein-tyrosine phosphatase